MNTNTFTADLFVVPSTTLDGKQTANIIRHITKTGACIFAGQLVTMDQLENIQMAYAVPTRKYHFYLADGYTLSIARED